tara:strand:+ start:219 stop:638 length:420 start_codon:yes stop_codon:yes gene_type:complete
MTGSHLFPPIKPSSRSYSPGEYPSTTFESLDGTKTNIRFGNRRVNAKLTLGFSNIPDSDAVLILKNYEDVNGNWDFIRMSSESRVGVLDADLNNYLLEYSSGEQRYALRWRYDGPPQVTSSYHGLSNVECKFVACLDSP